MPNFSYDYDDPPKDTRDISYPHIYFRNEAKRMIKKNRPTLIHVGQHLVDPNDVACITRIKGKSLYVVRLKSQPNMEYPIWVNKNEIGALIQQFNIVESD